MAARPVRSGVASETIPRIYGSVCSESTTDSSIAVGAYSCTCAVGYSGVNCDENIEFHPKFDHKADEIRTTLISSVEHLCWCR